MKSRDLAAAEAHRLASQSEIDQRKTLPERNKLGQFATPPDLAFQIARYVKMLRDNDGPVDFSDPAIGTGAFFSAFLRVFPQRDIASATGIELDPVFVGCARDLWKPFGLRVFQGDFTEFVASAGSYKRPNLILTNPPYVRHHHLEVERKGRLQALVLDTTGIKVSGLAGLYVYYLLLAHAWLEEGGLAAWLVPSEFMDVNYGGAIRQYLTERVTLLALHRFDPNEVQFGDALVSSTVVVLRKAVPASGLSAHLTYGGSLETPRLTQEVQLKELRGARKWTTYPMAKAPRTRPSDEPGEVVLGDLFKIQRGIATGANEFFILSREKAHSLRFPEECLRPILPSPRYLSETVIDRDGKGYPKVSQQLALIDCGLPQHEVRCRYPSLWAYLETAEERGLHQRYLLRQRDPWYSQEFRSPAPFLCTYMGRGTDEKHPFRFIWNRSDAIAPNVYLMLYPIGPLADLLKQRNELEALVFELLGRIKSSNLRVEGRVYGGGLYKIEPKELGRVLAAGFVRAMPDLKRLSNRQEQFKFSFSDL